MAKNDKQKHQGMINTQQTAFQDPMNQVRDQLNTTQNRFSNNYDTGVAKNFGSYDDIMRGYQGVVDDAASGKFRKKGYGGSDYNPQTIEAGPDPFKSYGGYDEFSRTGGFSEGDKQNMRERAIAPTRAVFQSNLRNINRQKALQGGYSPNATAAIAKSAREQSQAAADATVNSNADIAQMVQSGRLAGLGGMSGIEGQRYNRDFDIKKFNAGQQNWADENRGADRRFGYSNQEDPMANRLAALQGMTGLYGTTPAMAQLFGDQVLKNQGQILDAQGLQGQWGQNQIGNQFQNSQIKGNFGQVMDNVNSMMQPIANVGSLMTGVPNIWGQKQQRPMLPSGPGYGTYMDPSKFGQQVPVGGYR